MPTGSHRSSAAPILALTAAVVVAAACASSGSVSQAGSAPGIDLSTAAPSPDPRVGLKGGWFDAQEASWNVRHVSNTPPSADFINRSTPGDRRLVNSDLAFTSHYVIQGNYSGWQVWDVSNPVKPKLTTAYVCPGSQSDVSVYEDLLFVSGEATTGRLDCGLQGVPDTVSKDRLRGIRVFDISDMAHPKYVANVQTCRGSHTHTVVTDPNDRDAVYIYVSGSALVRPEAEMPGCTDAAQDPNTALFRIEVIKVPVAHPEQAAIVSSPRIFHDLAQAQSHHENAADSAEQARRMAAMMAQSGGAGMPLRRQRPYFGMGPTQCHDITVYPGIGRAGGACGGYGILLDITNPAQPNRLNAVADTNFSAWHSVTFNNDGTKVLFSDEWGGGSQPRCRATDKMEWGADAIYTLEGSTMTFKSYFKMPAAQTVFENCVAHNGSLIPIPGRDVMVQAWYQGGISIFDWTDASHPKEIAFYDRGPMDDTKFVDAGFWSAYWYNGYIYGSEIARGLDIFELEPSGLLSQNEIDAAKSVQMPFFNAQDQPKIVWPATFALSRAYLDQLARNGGLGADRIANARQVLASAERMSGPQRADALGKLAAELHAASPNASDQAKVHTLASSVEALAKLQ